jgi:hypothetical protein
MMSGSTGLAVAMAMMMLVMCGGMIFGVGHALRWRRNR